MSTPRKWVKAKVTNATDTSFPSKVATITEPSADGVLTVPDGANTIDLLFFGTGADNTTYDARVIGWKRGGNTWFPTIIADVSATLSAVTGAATGFLTTSERLADTLTLNNGTGYVGTVTADAGASPLTCDITDFEKIEVVFDLTGATDANALVSIYGDN